MSLHLLALAEARMMEGSDWFMLYFFEFHPPRGTDGEADGLAISHQSFEKKKPSNLTRQTLGMLS